MKLCPSIWLLLGEEILASMLLSYSSVLVIVAFMCWNYVWAFCLLFKISFQRIPVKIFYLLGYQNTSLGVPTSDISRQQKSHRTARQTVTNSHNIFSGRISAPGLLQDCGSKSTLEILAGRHLEFLHTDILSVFLWVRNTETSTSNVMFLCLC